MRKKKNINTTVLKVHTDGASWGGNSGKCSVGIIIKDNWCDNIAEYSLWIGKGTSNWAEFSALNIALSKLLAMDIKEEEIEFFSDSELLVNGINKRFNFSKSPHLEKLIKKIKNKLRMLKKPYSINYVPREWNVEADRLAKLIK